MYWGKLLWPALRLLVFMLAFAVVACSVSKKKCKPCPSFGYQMHDFYQA